MMPRMMRSSHSGRRQVCPPLNSTKQQWADLRRALSDVIGAERADTLMKAFPADPQVSSQDFNKLRHDVDLMMQGMATKADLEAAILKVCACLHGIANKKKAIITVKLKIEQTREDTHEHFVQVESKIEQASAASREDILKASAAFREDFLGLEMRLNVFMAVIIAATVFSNPTLSSL